MHVRSRSSRFTHVVLAALALAAPACGSPQTPASTAASTTGGAVPAGATPEAEATAEAKATAEKGPSLCPRAAAKVRDEQACITEGGEQGPCANLRGTPTCLEVAQHQVALRGGEGEGEGEVLPDLTIDCRGRLLTQTQRACIVAAKSEAEANACAK